MKYKLTKKQKKMTIRIIIALALLAVIAVTLHFIELPWWAELILYAIPYAIAGYDVLKTAFINLIHGQIFDEKFLMMVATVGAFGTGEYPEASAVMLFYQVGELFQSIAVGRSRKSIAKLMDIRPDSATVIRDGEEIEVSPEDVEVGEIIIRSPYLCKHTCRGRQAGSGRPADYEGYVSFPGEHVPERCYTRPLVLPPLPDQGYSTADGHRSGCSHSQSASGTRAHIRPDRSC